MKKWKIIIPIAIAVIVIGVVSTILIVRHNRFVLTQDEFSCELGEEPDSAISTYVDSKNKSIMNNSTLDFSNVDTSKIGTYDATVSYKKKILKFKVEVEDTTVPVIKCKASESTQTVGKNILVGSLIESIDELDGIKEIRVIYKNEVIASGTEANAISINWDTAGDYSIVIEVEDNSGNIGRKDFGIKCVKDYASMVTGFHDFSIQEGTSVDFMEGITKTEGITEIIPKAESVDLNTVGTYVITYEIHCDDGTTVLTHDVAVTVTAKPEQNKQTPSNNTASNTESSNSDGDVNNSGGNNGGGNSDGSYMNAANDRVIYADGSSKPMCWNSEVAGMTAAEYQAKYGIVPAVRTPNDALASLPSDYVLGSHATLTTSNGISFEGP